VVMLMGAFLGMTIRMGVAGNGCYPVFR